MVVGRLLLLGAALLAAPILLSGDDDADSVRLLPMDSLGASVETITSPKITTDTALRTYRVGRDVRPARVVHGPTRIARTVTAPGGRFETAIVPLNVPVTLSISLDGKVVARETAEPGAWTPVRAALPAGGGAVALVESLEAAAGEAVLWADDRIVPLQRLGKRPDVIVITLDTTRPDYLTPYNASETTTPALARLAMEGMRFDQATSVTSWTMPGHMALLTGLYPSLRLGFEERVGAEQTTLADVFAAAGYATAGASGGPYTDSDFGFQQGFRAYLDSDGWKNAERVTNWAIERITSPGNGAPLFMFLNYFDAHEPNTGIPMEEWVPFDVGSTPLTPKMIERTRSAYRADLQTIDRQLNRLFETIRLRRDWNNTVVVVTSDHGQLLGERGFVGHAISLDDELLRVPLIVKGTRGRQLRGVYTDQIQLTDVYPLTLELAGVGTHTRVLSRVASHEPVRRLAFARLRHQVTDDIVKRPRWRSAEQWAVRTDTVKVVRDKEGRVTMTSVGADPERPVNAPDLAARLLAELDKFGTGGEATGGAQLRLSSDLRDRLRSLGYIR